MVGKEEICFFIWKKEETLRGTLKCNLNKYRGRMNGLTQAIGSRQRQGTSTKKFQDIDTQKQTLFKNLNLYLE